MDRRYGGTVLFFFFFGNILGNIVPMPLGGLFKAGGYYAGILLTVIAFLVVIAFIVWCIMFVLNKGKDQG